MNQARLAHPCQERRGGCSVATEEGKAKAQSSGGWSLSMWVGLDQALRSLGCVNPHSSSTSISWVPAVHQLYTTLRDRKG